MQTLNATEVRKDFSRFIDSVVRDKPMVFKRNRDYIMSLSMQHAAVLLDNYSFQAQFITEDDGSITATLDNFDLVINARDKTSALTGLAEELIDYANDYFNQFQLYFNSPNRKAHFPYVLRILMQDNLEEVKGLINA